MLIVFKNKKKVITHQSGIVSEYDKAYLLKLKARMEKHLAKLNDDLLKLNLEIAQIENSMEV